MTTPNTSNLEINQSPKVSVIDSAKSTKHRSIFNITESTESPSLKLSSKHIRMKRPSIFCVDSTNISKRQMDFEVIHKIFIYYFIII